MAYPKISEKKVNQILELGEEDLSTKEISEKVGVSTGTVSRYLSKPTRSAKRPEPESSFEKVLALLETLLQEQKGARAILCPVCKFPLFADLNGDDVLFACINCGYRGTTPEPQWKEIEEFNIGRI